MIWDGEDEQFCKEMCAVRATVLDPVKMADRVADCPRCGVWWPLEEEVPEAMNFFDMSIKFPVNEVAVDLWSDTIATE